MRFQQIVIGIDFSPNSQRALAEAVRLQRDPHTGLVAVHIVESLLAGNLKRHLDLDEEEIRKQAEERLRLWVGKTAGVGHSVACEAVVAAPFEGLLHAVERHHADLLVLGSRGFASAGGHPGSVASKCVRKTNIDVMLVRRHQDGPFSRVVACADFSDTSVRAVERALAIAEADAAACDILHVHVPRSLSDLALEPFPPSTDLQWLEDLEKAEHAQFDAFCKAHVPVPEQAEAVFRVAANTTDGIIEYLQETQAELAVLGTRGRSGLRAFLLGTAAERLIHEAPCSLLVVKHH